MAYHRRSTGTVTKRTSVSPILTTPALGTPSAAVMTNLTGTLTSPTLVTPALGTPATGDLSSASTAGMVNYTRTITTPSSIQGDDQSYTDLTGSSISYTPPANASYVVYEYHTYVMASNQLSGGSETLQLIQFVKDGSDVSGYNFQINLYADGYDMYQFSIDGLRFKWVGPAWSGAETLSLQYRQWSTAHKYTAEWHQSEYTGDDTNNALFVDINRITYSVM